MARIQEPAPGFDSLAGIAGVLRAPVLRLEQVAVAAAGEVEGVSPRADQGPALAVHGGGAVADGADQDGQEWLRRKSKSIDILTGETILNNLWSMATRTVELDEEETLDAIEEQVKISTARDLLEYAKNMKVSEEALDRMEEVVQSRRRSPARIVDLD